MKHFTSLFTALLACGMLTTGTTAVSAQNNAATAPRIKKAAQTTVTRPQVVRHYYAADNVPTWYTEMVDSLSYDKNMNPVRKRIDYYADEDLVEYSTLLNYSYNTNGMLLEEIEKVTFDEAQTWENNYRTLYSYDTEVKNAAVSKEMFSWDTETVKWTYDIYAEGTYFLDITRDADKRVIETTQYINGSKEEATTKRVFEYGPNGAATTVKWDLLNDQTSYIQKDFSWRTTNSQFVYPTNDALVPFGNDPDNVTEFFILYNVNADGTEGEMAAACNSFYDDQQRISGIGFKMQNGSSIRENYQYDLDANGSYDMMKVARIQTPDGEETTLNHTIYTLNDKGDIISEEMFIVNPETSEETLTEGTKYERTYDDNGNLTALVTSIYDGAEYTYIEKEEYSDFADATTTGIAGLNADGTGITYHNGQITAASARGAIYVITDMNGRTVRRGIVDGNITTAGLPQGLYIVNINGSNGRTSVKLISK